MMDEERKKQSAGRALVIVFGVALVCALSVSTATIFLGPMIDANRDAEIAGQLQSVVDVLVNVDDSITTDSIEQRLVDLATGQYVDEIDVSTFDQRAAALDVDQSVQIPKDMDSASIRRRSKYAVVSLARGGDGDIAAIILPVWGIGYQSALHGYLALGADVSEILALSFYEQKETPGLGSQIQDANWESLWQGKQAFDESGQVSISVGSGQGESANQVAAISGATRTSLGVDGLVRFWLGDFGFGPFLGRLRQEYEG